MRLERHRGDEDWAALERGYEPGTAPSRHAYWLLIGPSAPGATAITLWSLILMRPRGVGNRRLLRHELGHVRQWHEHGVVMFLARYLGGYLRHRLRRYPHQAAYRRIPFEIEAEWQARRAETGH